MQMMIWLGILCAASGLGCSPPETQPVAATQVEDKDANTTTQRWRYFLREARFNRLLLDLAKQHQPTSFIVRGATILTMEGDAPLVDHAVVVENSQITSIAPSTDVPLRAGFGEIDGTGKFLVPGLVDMHVHTLTSSGDYLLDLINGVTGVREMDGFPWLLSVREQVRRNHLLAPNLYVSGTILNNVAMEWYAAVVKDPDQARALVRQQKTAGYDFIKVHNKMRPDCYDAILDEAKKLGIDVVGHIPHEIPLAKAIRDGQRTFEHLKGYYSDRSLQLTNEDYVALTREADVWNCPTLYTHRIGLQVDEVQRLLQTEEARYISRDERETWLTSAAGSGGASDRKIRVLSLRILKDLLPTKPRLLAGTDSGGGYPMMVRGFSLQQELRLLAEAGLSPADCLRTGTINAAQAMRKESEVGTIKPGKRADLLLIESDPREDVTALARIQGLSVRGIWLDRAAMERIREELQTVFRDEQGLADRETPTPERTDQLLATMTRLEFDGAIQMDHNLRELKELLIKTKRPTAPVDALLATRRP